MEGQDEIGRFAPGNSLWRLALGKTRGEPRKFETPEALAEACARYFEWVEANPLLEENLFAYQGSVTRASANKMRAMTLKALHLHIGITTETWCQWRKVRPDLAEVMSTVESIIWDQKFSGAAADLLNPAIVARELGLADKQEVDLTHAVKDMPDEDLLEEIRAISAKLGIANRGD